MSQEDVKPGNDTQEDKGQRSTDLGDAVSVLCIILCAFGAVWQFVDFGLLGGAQVIVDTFKIDSLVVWLGVLANVGVWVTGAYFCWACKTDCTLTAGARAIAAIAFVFAARLLVWLLAQLFGMCVAEGGSWLVAFFLACLVLCTSGWECLKAFFDTSVS